MSFSAVRAACTSMERKKAARDVKWGISLKFTFKLATEKNNAWPQAPTKKPFKTNG
jgi:hypothetical protein